MNNEFLYMQKLAGLITESEYQAKMNEGDYDSMSDHALIKAANEAGIEEIVQMDGEGGLANREEVIDHLNEFEHDNHGSFDAEMGEMEGEDYDDPNGGHSPDRYWGTDYRAQNEVEEGDDKQKKFADYIYNEYLKDAKQPMTAMRLSQEIMNDTDSRINPVYIKAAIKAHYPEIELK